MKTKNAKLIPHDPRDDDSVDYDAYRQEGEDEAVMDCGCLLTECSFTFCALHRAAGDLLKMSKIVANDLNALLMARGRLSATEARHMHMLRGAIAKAEDKNETR